VSLAPNRLVLYARDVEGTAAFYEKHFGFKVLRLPGDRIVELVAQNGGANIMIHAAAKGVKTEQVTVKLVLTSKTSLTSAKGAPAMGSCLAPRTRQTGIPTRTPKTLAETISK
jgi:hypothetical protein